MRLRIDTIRLDGGTQPRAELNYDTIADYAEAMGDGADFPPVTVFYDGADYWLADGFHRVRASQTIGFEEVFADVRQGTRRDAILYSVSANSVHGMRRTNADKRRAVETLLRDDEWGKWSDSEIARRCAVSSMTVGRIRKESIINVVNDTPRLVERNGTVYEQRTENIGRRAVITDDGDLIVEDEEDFGDVAPQPERHPIDPLAIERHVDEHAPQDDESDAMYLTKLNYKRLTRKERAAFINWLNLRGDIA